METVTLSSKYQVVIPKAVREAAGLMHGTKLHVLLYGTRIELVPVQPLTSLKGVFPSLNTTIDREDDRL